MKSSNIDIYAKDAGDLTISGRVTQIVLTKSHYKLDVMLKIRQNNTGLRKILEENGVNFDCSNSSSDF